MRSPREPHLDGNKLQKRGKRASLQILQPQLGFNCQNSSDPPKEEAEKWNKELERWMTDERQTFETFIREFRDFVLALAKEPITSGSGLYDEKEIKQGQADRRLEIENQLTRLPIGVAWCRVQNATGELEEHVIQLAQSTTPLENKSEVERWIEEIKERMLAHGYLRAITEVEKEISERHALLRFPPKPPEPPLLPDKPDEPPSSPRRKKIA